MRAANFWLLVLWVLGISTPVLGWLLIRAKARVRELEAYIAGVEGSGRLATLDSGISTGETLEAQGDARFAALEAQIDRLADGQEFLTRVLADRLELPRAPQRPIGSITPH